MAESFADDEEEVPEYDPSTLGPEYWLNKNARYRIKQFSKCLKCGMKQLLSVADDSCAGICPNKQCKYVERIIDWRVPNAHS